MTAASLPMAPESAQACRNCNAALDLADGRMAHFCPDCGQETDLRPPTVVALFRELISHYAAAEGRLWPTLVGLLAKPGFLTTEYFAGRRRRYIIPTRLYLTTSILFFVLVKVLGAGSLANISEGAATGASPAATSSEAAKANPKYGPRGPANIRIGPNSKGAGMDDSFLTMVDCSGGVDSYCTKLKDWLAAKYGNLTVREFAMRIKDRMVSLAPYAMFLLLPVFAALTRLLYWRRGLYYSEHLVYALHVHSFAFLLLLVISVLPKAIADWVWLAGMVYFWLAMKNVFGGRWWMTTLRYALLGFTYPVLLSFSIVLVLALAILL